MKKIALFIFCAFLSNYIFSQKEGNIWYFGNNAGVSFNTSPPTALTNGKLSQREGCSSVCDKNGNLLFYTDGQKVYDRQHNLMSNGSGLLGNNSSCQSGVIIPWPDSTSKYFIITVDAIENSATYGVRYSVVDMRLNSGYGDVVSSEKNIVLTKPQCEKATAVLQCNKRDFWLVTNHSSSDSILAFAITPAGINKKAVRSNTGYSMSGNLNNNLGYLNPSHDGKKLVSCHFLLDMFLLMDFDNQTGKVSNVMSFSKPAAYCGEFSPNNKILYVSGLRSPTSIDQFDISSNNQTTIQSSKKLIFNYGSGEMGALKLASDGKIYATSETTGYNGYIGAISTPDSIGPYYSPKNIYLSGKMARLGLPNIFYSTPFNGNQSIAIKDTCFLNLTSLNLTVNPSGTTTWNFADPASGANNIATGTKVTHTFTAPGKYRVMAIYNTSCITDTVYRDLTIINTKQKFSIGNDTTICPSNIVTLKPNTTGLSYTWSTGETTSSINVNSNGKYWLQINFSCGASRDTIEIFEKVKNTDFIIPRDTFLCQKIVNYPLIVKSLIAHQTLWNTGEKSDTILVSAAGKYIVNMKHICGNYIDTIVLSEFNYSKQLRDTSYCFPSTQNITNSSINKIKWSTGDTTQSIQISLPGQYIVEETNKYCKHIDTVIISSKTKATKIFVGNDTIICDKPISQNLSVSCIDQHTTLWSNGATTDNTTVVDSGYYFVTVKNVCHTFKDTIRIELFNKYLNLGRDTALCFASDFIISVPNRPNYQYKWQDGSSGNTFAAKRKGQYYLTTSYGKCQSSDTLNISGDDATDELYIPNAFSPNDDEVNDFFPFTSSSKPIDIEIYNRWGEKIYDAKKSQIGWNGVYKNTLVESGVYLYKIKYKDCSNRNVFVKGTFTVIY